VVIVHCHLFFVLCSLYTTFNISSTFLFFNMVLSSTILYKLICHYSVAKFLKKKVKLQLVTSYSLSLISSMTVSILLCPSFVCYFDLWLLFLSLTFLFCSPYTTINISSIHLSFFEHDIRAIPFFMTYFVTILFLNSLKRM